MHRFTWDNIIHNPDILTHILQAIAGVVSLVGLMATLTSLATPTDTDLDDSTGAHTTTAVSENANPAPASSSKITLNQGDEIVTYNNVIGSSLYGYSPCTAGFYDEQHHRMITAAHCGRDGADVFNAHDELVGTFRKYQPSSDYNPQNDLGYVELLSSVEATNVFTQERDSRRVDYQSRLCSYSRNLGDTTCSDTAVLVSGTVQDYSVHKNVPSRGGDSGGPVWFEDGGFAGVISGSTVEDSSPAILVAHVEDHLL